MAFVPRKEKASWGLPCNQSADGNLWAGKGYEKSLAGQFGMRTAQEIRRALAGIRGDRCGRFWIDFESRKITMAVGESAMNEYESASF